jgi:hypothetical protein
MFRAVYCTFDEHEMVYIRVFSNYNPPLPQITTHFPLAGLGKPACEGDVLAFDFNREVRSFMF